MIKIENNNLSQNLIICKNSEIKGIRQYNKNGELLYNIDNIKKICNEKENDSLIRYIGLILNEPRTDLIKIIFKDLGKEFLINKLIKTCEIENKGGMKKKKLNNDNENFERKTPGGVFLNLIKNDEESKSIFKKILKKDSREKRERKKFYKSLEKLEL